MYVFIIENQLVDDRNVLSTVYPVVDNYKIDLMEIIILSSRMSMTSERLKLKTIEYKNVYLYVIFDFIYYFFFIISLRYHYTTNYIGFRLDFF